MTSIDRPGSDEYHEFYAHYVDLVPAGDILALLEDQQARTLATLVKLDEDKANHRYAPEKWSIKDLLGHMIDTERLFAFRALWFARRDPVAQPGMEQDDWAASARHHARTLRDIREEYRTVREASLSLFRSFDAQMWSERGIASEREFTVRSIPYIIEGHELHHMEILQSRYL
jgi:hypothetical protein